MLAEAIYDVVCEERPHQLVERLPVATRHDHGSHRGYGRRPRHGHRGSDLAEIVAGSKEAPRPEIALADRQNPREDDVEAIVRVALPHHDGARRDLLALHAPRELTDRLARQPGEELDPCELVLGG